jgi:hypothetical protein
VLTLFNSAAAWFAAFSHFANYDDEGYFIGTLRSLFAGRPLYDRVETMYGPLYYCYQWCAHVLMGTAPTTDSVRLVTVVFWTLTCLAAFWLFFQLTRSVLFGVLANCLTFQALGYLGPEHAHPQEMVLLLLLAIPLAAAGMRSEIRLAALWGVLAGALLALKINVGVYALVAIGVVMTRGTGRRLLFFAAAAAALALPAAVMVGRLTEHWALLYCFIVTCSTVGPVAVIASKKSPARFGAAAFGACVLGFVVAVAASSAFCLAHGSTLRGMFTNLVVLPRQMMGGWWFLPVPLRRIWLALPPAGLTVAMYVPRRAAVVPGLAAFKLVVASAVLLCGAAGWWAEVLLIGAPFLWIVSINTGSATAGGTAWHPQLTLARSVLLAVGTATLLYPYPVAGSQMRLAGCLVLLIGLICFYDVCAGMLQRLEDWSRLKPAAAIGLFACLFGAAYLFQIRQFRQEYQSYMPLGFPGTARLRLEPRQAEVLRGAVAGVPSSCGLLATAPNLSSMNLWTERPAPARLAVRTFSGAQSADEQAEIIHELSRRPDTCIILNSEQALFWSRGRDLSDLPLMRFLADRYTPAWKKGAYQLLIAK